MLGSPYGGAGGVYGNTINDTDHNAYFNRPYCDAYNTGISFSQTDTSAGCPLKQYFGNPVGGGADLLSGREAAAGASPGALELTEAMLSGESNVIYVLWEITPGPDAVWSAGNWTVRLNVTSRSSFITWTGVEIVHVNKNCNGIEQLGNLTGQSVSLNSAGVVSMVVPGSAPASTPAPDDKALLLLSFSNSSMQSQSFGYTPSQLIDSPFARLGALVYTNQPQPANHVCDPTYRTFSPTPTLCNAPTVIYQYTIGIGTLGCPVGTHKADYDLANAMGLSSTW